MEKIKTDEKTTLSLAITNAISDILGLLDVELPKGLKVISNVTGVVGNLLGAADSINLLYDIRDKNYAIEHIVYWQLGDYIQSKTREGVEAKYIYAYFAVADRIEQGIITYEYDDGTYWVNSWYTEKQELIEEIQGLDKYY